jgi:hypothetical protein
MNIVNRAEALGEACDVPEKSDGQKVLEQLLAVQQHMIIIESQLGGVRKAIGVPPATPGPEATTGSAQTAFLPALRELAAQMEIALGRIETHANEIAKAF